MKVINCKFCDSSTFNNMQGYCQSCYKYFVLEDKIVYPLPKYGEITYAPNGDCICPECGKAFRKLGMHIFYAHHQTTKEFFPKYGWSIRNTKASNKQYRSYMKAIQHPKCISVNLIEQGESTRFNQPNGNKMQLPTHSMKSRCSKCCYMKKVDSTYYCTKSDDKCSTTLHCPIGSALILPINKNS